MPRLGEILNAERKKDFQEVVKYYKSFKIASNLFEKENLEILNEIHKLAFGISVFSLKIENIPEHAKPYLLQFKSDAIQLMSFFMIGTNRAYRLLERSLIENLLRYIYYFHHEIEHTLLQMEPSGYINFKNLCDYAKRHPFFKENSSIEVAIRILKSKYSELSRAIHAGSTGELSVVDSIVSTHIPISNVDKEIKNLRTISQNVMYTLACFHSAELASLSLDERRVVTLLLSTAQKRHLSGLV